MTSHSALFTVYMYIVVLKNKHCVNSLKHTLYSAICSQEDYYIVTPICKAQNKTLCQCTVWICLQGSTWMQFRVIWMPFMRQGLFWTVLKSSSTIVAASGPGYRGVMSTGPINDGRLRVNEWGALRGFLHLKSPCAAAPRLPVKNNQTAATPSYLSL